MGNVNVKGWAMVPGLLIEDFSMHKVSGEAVAMYALIRLQWGWAEAVFPKQEIIAKRADCSVSKVRRLLKELNDTGWILSERQHITHGYNQYFICDEPFVKPKISARQRKLNGDAEEK